MPPEGLLRKLQSVKGWGPPSTRQWYGPGVTESCDNTVIVKKGMIVRTLRYGKNSLHQQFKNRLIFEHP